MVAGLSGRTKSIEVERIGRAHTVRPSPDVGAEARREAVEPQGVRLRDERRGEDRRGPARHRAPEVVPHGDRVLDDLAGMLGHALLLEGVAQADEMIGAHVFGRDAEGRAVVRQPFDALRVRLVSDAIEEVRPLGRERHARGEPGALHAEALDRANDQRADVGMALGADAEAGRPQRIEELAHRARGRRGGVEVDAGAGLQHVERGERIASGVALEEEVDLRPHVGEHDDAVRPEEGALGWGAEGHVVIRLCGQERSREGTSGLVPPLVSSYQ